MFLKFCSSKNGNIQGCQICTILNFAGNQKRMLAKHIGAKLCFAYDINRNTLEYYSQGYYHVHVKLFSSFLRQKYTPLILFIWILLCKCAMY